jgi:flagellar hook-associated protein 2
VATLFGSDGVSGALRSSVDLLTRFGDGTITNQLSNIDKRVASDTTKAKDAQARLDFRRTQLEQQFASMETLLAKLNSQSSFLTQQFNSLSKSN